MKLPEHDVSIYKILNAGGFRAMEMARHQKREELGPNQLLNVGISLFLASKIC